MKSANRVIRTAIAVPLIGGALAAQAAADARRTDNWNRVTALQPGTIVAVTARDAAPTHYLAVFADSQTLVVVRFVQAQSLERVECALRDLPPASLATLSAASIRVDGITFSHGTVLDRAIKVAEIVPLPKDDIVEIEITGRGRRGSATGAVIGVGVGIGAALLIAPQILFRRCGGSCNDELALFYGTAIGLPVGGGVLGYYGGRDAGTRVIYRAPAVQPLVLDEAAWQRVRRELPPSLRDNAAGK